MKVLYFTHCCAKKDNSLRGTGKKVSPMELYQATPTQRFMKRCNDTRVEWAIFSDKYAFVFPSDRIPWYEKHPSILTQPEKSNLFANAFKVLKRYTLAYFYHNPGRLHPFYRELVEKMRRRECDIRKITHLDDVSNKQNSARALTVKLRPLYQRVPKVKKILSSFSYPYNKRITGHHEHFTMEGYRNG